ncbi:hypothetical protein IQ06DRAFT_368374 [Phaeosphaeriaceae sp. SRC1lsM3a]|nr:hypothetical protein IQ06DRAFT_368374 [Stagonospora sp. SRC1lsM3a]
MSNVEQSHPRASRAISPENLTSEPMGSLQGAPVETSSGELNSIEMSNLQEPSTSAPAGIEEDVLAKINAFLEQSEPTQPSISRRNSSHQMEVWWSRTDSTSSNRSVLDTRNAEEEKDRSAIEEDDDFELDPDEFRLPPSESSFESDEEYSEKDALISQGEVSTGSSQFTDPNAPKIIARYIYTSERTPPHLPPRQVIPLPTLSSLLAMFCSYLLSFIISNKPDIIEYSPLAVKHRAGDISVEAQVVEFPAQPEKVVGVVALLHTGDGEHRRALPITAKPKRVRELMAHEVGRLTEDVYEKEIKGALNALQKMVDGDSCRGRDNEERQAV